MRGDAPATFGVPPSLYGDRVHARRHAGMTHRAVLKLVIGAFIMLITPGFRATLMPNEQVFQVSGVAPWMVVAIPAPR